MQSRIYNYSKEDFLSIIENSNTLTEVLVKVGLSPKGSNHTTLVRRCEKDGIDLSGLKERSKIYSQTLPRFEERDLDEVLVENSSYSNRGALKKRLLANGMLTNICSICGLQPIWNQQKLMLVLDHINGISNDNRIENLRLICPNCNSQTPTFAGRKVEKATRVYKKKESCLECGKPVMRKGVTGLCSDCYLQTVKKC